MKITIEVSDELIKSAIISGAENWMTRAWATNIRYGKGGNVFALSLTEQETGKHFELHPGHSWHTALQLMAVKNPYQFGLVLSGKGDAITGDVLIQFATLGEEKYG